MSYDVNEKSVQDGHPIEVYRFKIGTQTFRYTSAQRKISLNTGDGGIPELYLPLEMQRTDPEQGKELARATITVTVPRNAGIANQFIAFLPSKRVYLTIYRSHEDAVEFIQIWKGRVKSCAWKGSLGELECAPTLNSLKRAGVRKNFGGTCQHALYDGGCKVLKTDYDTSVLISNVNSTVLTGTGEISGSSAADWFVAGYAERVNGEVRYIIAQAGDTVTILFPFTGLAPGETVTLYAGCKHDIEICFAKFNTAQNPDAANFYGFHVNPKRNPFVTGLN